MQYIFKPFIYVYISYVYIFFFYQGHPYHHYILLNIETDYHNLKENIRAACLLYTSGLFDHIYII